jgi:hypothetical protein
MTNVSEPPSDAIGRLLIDAGLVGPLQLWSGRCPLPTPHKRERERRVRQKAGPEGEGGGGGGAAGGADQSKHLERRTGTRLDGLDTGLSLSIRDATLQNQT